jgi:hypothetical protein
MEPEGLLSCFQDPATNSYRKSHESSQHLHILSHLFKLSINVILTSRP